MPLQVIPVTTPEQLQCAYAIRKAVFIMEQQLDADLQFDAYDEVPGTFHFLGKDTDTGEIIATARCVVFPDERKGKIGRVAVKSECRGKKYGAELMNAVEQALKDQCDKFVLSAQFDKRTFYERCGYTRTSDDIYYEMEVEHCMMVKYVSV